MFMGTETGQARIEDIETIYFGEVQPESNSELATTAVPHFTIIACGKESGVQKED